MLCRVGASVFLVTFSLLAQYKTITIAKLNQLVKKQRRDYTGAPFFFFLFPSFLSEKFLYSNF